MVRESGLFKMLEFDLWMFFFAIFQLILTNVIIFKLVSIIYSIYTPNTLNMCHRTSSTWIQILSYSLQLCYLVASSARLITITK